MDDQPLTPGKTGESAQTQRVAYRLVPWRSLVAPDTTMVRIQVIYLSGSVRSMPGHFAGVEKAEQFIARFYPDLVGRNTPNEPIWAGSGLTPEI